jgi:hypothetical protein
MSPHRGGSIHEYSGIAPIRIRCVNEAAVTLFSELERKRNEFDSYGAMTAAGAARQQ